MAIAFAFAASGCNLPRGAGLYSEIKSEEMADTSTFTVVPVSRVNIAQIGNWPMTGGAGGYRWVGNDRGPDSALIRSGDKIDLMIFDNQENSLLAPVGQKTVAMQAMQVSATGAVFIPYVGEVVINGLTAAQARKTIQDALAPLAPSAQVMLNVQPGRQNSVDLVSGVVRPGAYPLPDRNFTILGLIAQGGGIQPGLRNPLVRMIRGDKTYEVRAERLFADAALNTVLRGGDKVIVQEDRRYFTALGATGTERLIYFEKDHITAIEALSIIGGIAEARANPKGVLVLRDYPAAAVRNDGTGPVKTQVVFAFDLTTADGLFSARQFEINPSDTVLATESPVIAAQTIAGLIGAGLGLRNAASAN